MARKQLTIAQIRREDMNLQITLSDGRVFLLDPDEQTVFGIMIRAGQPVKVVKPILGILGRPQIKPA